MMHRSLLAALMLSAIALPPQRPTMPEPREPVPPVPPPGHRIDRVGVVDDRTIEQEFGRAIRDSAESGYVRVIDDPVCAEVLDIPRSNPFPSRPTPRYPASPAEQAIIDRANEKRRRKGARRLRETLRAAWSGRVG